MTVVRPATGVDDLAAFMQQLAEDWRGWPGRRCWHAGLLREGPAARPDGMTRPAANVGEPDVRGSAGVHSLRAVSGPVIRRSSGSVEAMMPSDTASPPATMR
ncbi:DUF6228 family protein [Micromonospora sp. CB01531]|uniref:DUF6228 family protein n=1 Tax=Micromonospora sp. CB01531 TaxID=1718947 RepID=UPI003FD17637